MKKPDQTLPDGEFPISEIWPHAPDYAKVTFPHRRSRRLFFEKRDIPRVRENARSRLLGATYQKWAAHADNELRTAWEQFRKSGDILFDLMGVLNHFTELALMEIVEPDREHERTLLDSIREFIDLPKWDYLLDGDAVIGVMRASMATSQILFAREVLEGVIDPELDRKILDAVAEKGALPCYRTLYGMEYPETVKGWRNDENHQPFHEVDMSRWPVIFGSNNLRGAPTAALGLGALALEGHDDRARLWLRAAESSARSLFQLFSRDGSFFEGLSYSDYTLRTILSFCDAHHRIKGTVDWAESMNFSGFLDYIVTMQAGKNKDGNPDIVNFSDANKSIYPCVSSWIERETGDPRAQYITEYFSTPGYFLDFLWYRTERPMECPPVSLKNRCNELEWVICRSGWQEEDAVLAFRSGFPANHEHSDRNSFFCKIYGERLLTDHFGAAYNRNDPKWSLRLTQGHNAVLIDGKGQQYHNGEEGVNESQSEARVVRFRDGGEKVWWVSDATPAYRLVNPDIVRVVRTVAFAKPDIVILFDQVVLDSTEAKVEVRFFPDNRDDSAEISVAGSTFHISRPRAELFAGVASPGALELGTARLSPADPLPGYEPDPRCKTAGTEFGNYPFVSVHTSPGKTHTIVTAFTARKGRGGVAPEINLEKNDRGWFCRVAGFRCDIDTRSDYPVILWG